MSLELAVLGTGHLASAILDGVFNSRLFQPDQVMIADHHADRRVKFESMGCEGVESAGALRAAPRILLAVRPQEFASAASELGSLTEEQLVISVMAGIDSMTIRTSLGGTCRVIRTMPNMGALLGQSMTALAQGIDATDADMEFVTRLFDAIGRIVLIDEELMSAATAVCGSGPGWVFLLAASMIEGAQAVGFDAETAEVMVRQTLLGAAMKMQDEHVTVEELLDRISSKGGTTEAGLSVMRSQHLPKAVRDGIVAARDRGEELRSH